MEARHLSLKDLRGIEQFFGGAVILLFGDFQQTRPVIPRSAPADELNAYLKSPVLWRHVHKLSLKNQLLDIGNGKMAIDESTQCITLHSNFCKITATRDELIQKAYPNISQNYKNQQWISKHAKQRYQSHKYQH